MRHSGTERITADGWRRPMTACALAITAGTLAATALTVAPAAAGTLDLTPPDGVEVGLTATLLVEATAAVTTTTPEVCTPELVSEDSPYWIVTGVSPGTCILQVSYNGDSGEMSFHVRGPDEVVDPAASPDPTPSETAPSDGSTDAPSGDATSPSDTDGSPSSGDATGSPDPAPAADADLAVLSPTSGTRVTSGAPITVRARVIGYTAGTFAYLTVDDVATAKAAVQSNGSVTFLARARTGAVAVRVEGRSSEPVRWKVVPFGIARVERSGATRVLTLATGTFAPGTRVAVTRNGRATAVVRIPTSGPARVRVLPGATYRVRVDTPYGSVWGTGASVR